MAQDSGTAPVSVTPTAEPAPVPTDATDAVDPLPASEVAEGDETVVVTGSRVRRSTFNSASPIQILDGEKSRELGLTNTADIIQGSNVANGLQIDSTISGGFVTGSGPGSSTISLRNLDESRTLVLINGRRLAPAGVEGAPVAANLNMVPTSLVERVEVLLDGASSVYGSDAIAGVANVILRSEFDGFQLSGTTTLTGPAEGAGETTTISGIWGSSDTKYNIMVAAEYRKQEQLAFKDRGFASICPNGGLNREIDPRTNEEFNFDPRNSLCRSPFLVGYIANIGFYYTPGTSNTGFDNFSTLRRNPDGSQQVDVFSEAQSRYTDRRNADLIPGVETYSVFGTGDYQLDEASNTEIFFEASYSNQKANFDNGLAQIFDIVPAANPFNPVGDSVFGPGEGVDAQVVFGISGDRTRSEIEIEQYRSVVGLRGDLAFMNSMGLSNWTYEASISYTRSKGSSSLEGVLDGLNPDETEIDRRGLLLAYYTTQEVSPGVFACGRDVDPTLPECVPFNPFSDAVLGRGEITQEERDFLYGLREFDTESEQLILNAYITGDLFTLPGGEAQGVLGVEYRDDTIDSIPNDVARDGLFWGYSKDEGATGSADIFEVFAEIDLPILKDQFLAEDLEVNLSGRYSNQEFYGEAWTYSAKAIYAPFDWIKIRGTYGTAFRAPNLGEFFKGGQSGFVAGGADPCVVPAGARLFDATTGRNTYNPDGDERDPVVVANCIADGVNPTQLGLQGVPSIETLQGGSKELEAETSRAFSAGIVLEQPWIDEITFRIGVTYYEIEVENSIASPTAGFILGECYEDAGRSPFCSRIERDFTNTTDPGLISIVDTSFLNIGIIETRGFDYNVFYTQSFDVGGEELDLTIDASASQTLQSDTTTFGVLDRFKGAIGVPEWRATIDGELASGPWSFLWRARFIGNQPGDGEVAGLQTCGYANPPPSSSTARDPDCLANRIAKTWAEAYWEHTVSVSYTAPEDAYKITLGLDNVFDQDPVTVDFDAPTGVLNSASVPLGVGYDQLGRTAFLRIGAKF